MPNQTLTPSKIFRVTSGWNVIDSTGQEWWIPTEDRQTKQSNQPLVDEILASIGKPIELATWVKDDGSTHAIFGKPKPKKDSKWGMTPEERVAERRSIEAQKAAGIAVAILGSIPDHSLDLEQALAWVCGAIPLIAGTIRQTATLTPVGASVEAGGWTPNAPARGREAIGPEVPISRTGGDRGSLPALAGSAPDTSASTPPLGEEPQETRATGSSAAGNGHKATKVQRSSPTTSDATPDELNELISACGGSAVAATKLARDKYGVATLRKLTHAQCRALIGKPKAEGRA